MSTELSAALVAAIASAVVAIAANLLQWAKWRGGERHQAQADAVTAYADAAGKCAEMLTSMQIELAELRAKMAELERNNRELRDRISALESENSDLRVLLEDYEQQNKKINNAHAH